MASPELPQSTIDLMREMWTNGDTQTEIVLELKKRGLKGASAGSVTNHTRDLPRQRGKKAHEEEKRAFREEADGSATVAIHTDRPVKTLADAIRVAEVDESVWYVDHWEVTDWTMPMKVGPKGDKQGVITQQYRVKVYLRRIMRRSYQEALNAIFDRMAKQAPRYPKLAKPKAGPGEEFLAVFGLFDAHFGRLAWAPETGKHYDLKIAETLYLNAVDDLIAESAHRRIGKILLPIGNDFYHIDNSRNTTHAGTPQDVDGRYAKLIAAGEMAVILAVEKLMAVAPVSVLWVPGNHDPTTSYHLARTIAAWFRQAERVEVDCSPSPRKYLTWGANLIGLTHGNEEKLDDLPDIMANERSKDWAACNCREWLVGHWHHSKKYVTKEHEQRRSSVVRVLRSLAGTDAWHHRKGYVGTNDAAEVYWYGRTRGYAGHAIVPARHETKRRRA